MQLKHQKKSNTLYVHEKQLQLQQHQESLHTEPIRITDTIVQISNKPLANHLAG